jgi:uncharacterized membrane protein
VLPFHIRFQSIAGGISTGIIRLAITLPDRFFILYGHFLFTGVLFTWVLIKNMTRIRKSASGKNVKAPRQNWAATFKSLAAWASEPDMFVFVLFAAGCLLIIIPELVYVRDIYEGGWPRANTMFKLTYQGYILFTLAIGYAVVRIRGAKDEIKINKGLRGCLTLCVALPLLFTLPKPFGGRAIDDYYHVTSGGAYQGLDGLAFINKNAPGDYAAITWLNENVKGTAVVLTASGNTYTEYGRVNMATGLPTVANSRTHEWLWRNDIEAYDRRKNEVTRMYESSDIDEVRALIKKYDVSYVLVGPLEQDAYESLNESMWENLGRVVSDTDETRLYQIK